MYRATTVLIKKGHRLHDYCKEVCTSSAKLYNRANFIVRQYATAVRDFESMKPLTENQISVYTLVRDVTSGTKYAPDGKWLSYWKLDYIFKVTKDAAYYGMHSQSNQQTLKLLMHDYKSFFEAIKVYKANPAVFTGRPKLPGYVKDGQPKTAVVTNQICVVKDKHYIKFPGTKERLNAGADINKLQVVRIRPGGDAFEISIVYEAPDIGIRPISDAKVMKTELDRLARLTDISDKRIIAIDPGGG